jgi:trk system potassium uptake protein TrkA
MVDNRSGAFHRLPAEFKGKTVLGNGIDQDVLREAKAEDSDILIVATDSDNTNIMAALVGQKILHIPRVLARIYDQTRTASYQNYGIETFSPTELVAGLMRDSIRKGN